jgi:hypothetical protein
MMAAEAALEWLYGLRCRWRGHDWVVAAQGLDVVQCAWCECVGGGVEWTTKKRQTPRWRRWRIRSHQSYKGPVPPT